MSAITEIPKDILDAATTVVRLHLDIGELCDSVVPRVSDPDLRSRIERAQLQHEQRSHDLVACLADAASQPSLGPGTRALYTPGSIVASDLAGDASITKALAAAEREMLAVLERAVEVGGSEPELHRCLNADLEESRAHSRWLEARVAAA